MSHPHRLPMILLAVLVFSASAAWLWTSGAAGRGVRTLDRLPRDPLVAGYVVLDDPVGTLDYWLDLLGEFSENERTRIDGKLGQLDAKLGFSLREDLLAQIGPEATVAFDLDSIDESLGAAMGGAGESAVLSGFLLVVQIRDRDSIDSAARRMAQLAEAELTQDDDLYRVRFGRSKPSKSGAEKRIDMYYGLSKDLFAAGFDAKKVREAMQGFPEGERLADGADFARVASRLDASPVSMSYVNLPRLRTLLEDSVMVKGWTATSPQARTLLEVLARDEWTGVGMGSSSIELDGGLQTTRFGPTLLSRVDAYRGLSVWAGVPGLLTYAGAIEGLLGSVSSGSATEARKSMATLRTIATACESHAIDHTTYPGPTDGWVPIRTMAGDLEPTYIGELPTLDGWGHEILYWSDTRSYRLVSPGQDGVPAQDWRGEVDEAASDDAQGDLVFGDGRFLVWWQGH